MHSTGQAFAAQVRLVRGEGSSFAAQITGLQRVRLAAGEACGQLRLARERGQRAVLHAALGESVRRPPHRHGLVQLRVLVGHLDQSGLLGGGSTVAWGGRGDRVCLHVLACARKVTGVSPLEARLGRLNLVRTHGCQGEARRGTFGISAGEVAGG